MRVVETYPSGNRSDASVLGTPGLLVGTMRKDNGLAATCRRGWISAKGRNIAFKVEGIQSL